MATLRIQAHNLGMVSEVHTFLADLEFAYNSIIAFEFIVDVLVSERDRRSYELRRQLDILEDIEARYKDYKRYPFLFDFIYGEYSGRQSYSRAGLMGLLGSIKIEEIVLPEDRLILSKINIQSPGFWECIGSLGPLKQLRELLKDSHERKKDREYRNEQERQRGELDILEKRESLIQNRIQTLRSLGYNEVEIRAFIAKMITAPLQRLERYQDMGIIDDVDEVNPDV